MHSVVKEESRVVEKIIGWLICFCVHGVLAWSGSSESLLLGKQIIAGVGGNLLVCD